MLMTRKTGKLTANKPIGTDIDQREHGTRYKTGARGVLTPDVVREFASYGMSLKAIGYLVGCSKQNIHECIKDDPDLQQAWCEGVADLLYRAGKCISANIDKDNWIPALATLKSKSIPGEKGWIEEQYQDKKLDPDSNPKVVIYLPENNRDSPNNDDEPADDDSFLVRNGRDD